MQLVVLRSSLGQSKLSVSHPNFEGYRLAEREIAKILALRRYKVSVAEFSHGLGGKPTSGSHEMTALARTPVLSGRIWTPPDCNRFWQALFKVTTADVYPASLRGLIDHRREPRWIFARFHLNDAKALAEAMPVQTPGSGSDGGYPFRHRPPFDCNCRGGPFA